SPITVVGGGVVGTVHIHHYGRGWVINSTAKRWGLVIGAEIGQGHHRRCGVHGIALAVVDAAAVARNISEADIGI
ncbi:hypothetical protein ABE407_17265, partial [Acinetobacter modestus]